MVPYRTGYRYKTTVEVLNIKVENLNWNQYVPYGTVSRYGNTCNMVFRHNLRRFIGIYFGKFPIMKE